LGLFGCAAFWIFAPSVCEVLAHRHLLLTGRLAPVYAILFGLIALCNPFLSLLPGLKKESQYLVAIIAAAVVVLISDVVLVPRMGAIGAAYGQICGTVTLLVLSAIS